MKLYFTLFCCLLASLVQAQKFTITGKVVDSASNPIESATVYLNTVSDSSLVTYTITNKNGEFELRGAAAEENVRLFISYIGYKTLKKKMILDQEKFSLGKIVMAPANQLDEVTITATRAPVVVKSDTLQFNAQSFETGPNSNLEELLEKLPGAKVDKNGNITINGKPVNKILVNGEKFFGGDPKIATKNLPKEIIDKLDSLA